MATTKQILCSQPAVIAISKTFFSCAGYRCTSQGRRCLDRESNKRVWLPKIDTCSCLGEFASVKPSPAANMKYITLSSNHEMPIIGLGTWQSPPDEMQKIVESALSCGYRHFDTAFNYNTEESLGKTLREWINNGSCTREDLFVVTKLPNFANRPEDVPKYFNLSLQRLKLDYVDLYLIHMPFGFVADNTGEAPAKDEDGNFLLDKATDHTSIWKTIWKRHIDQIVGLNSVPHTVEISREASGPLLTPEHVSDRRAVQKSAVPGTPPPRSPKILSPHRSSPLQAAYV